MCHVDLSSQRRQPGVLPSRGQELNCFSSASWWLYPYKSCHFCYLVALSCFQKVKLFVFRDLVASFVLFSNFFRSPTRAEAQTLQRSSRTMFACYHRVDEVSRKEVDPGPIFCRCARNGRIGVARDCKFRVLVCLVCSSLSGLQPCARITPPGWSPSEGQG